MSSTTQIAFMFSGQGAQYAGMGKELCENFSVCREVFEEADDTLGLSLSKIIFDGDEKLNETEFTQPSLLTLSYAIYKLMEQNNIKANYHLGLSLGEYSALTASSAFSFAEAVALVKKRGRFMTEAVPVGVGAMSAIFHPDASVVEKICKEVSEKVKFVTPANYNMAGQIVIAGYVEAVAEAEKELSANGAKRCVRLNVAGPFHTKLLEPAAVKLEAELKQLKINELQVPVVTNLTADFIKNTSDIIPTLVEQVKSPVRWQQSVQKLVDLGVETFIELGAGKTLCAFAKSTGKNICNVEDVASFEKTLSKL